MNYSGKGLAQDSRGNVPFNAGPLVGCPNRRPVRCLIAAKSMRGIELVPVLDVRCFLAHQKYVTAFHGKGESIITESLRHLEVEFADAFLRVHRNALVSIRFIEGFEHPAPKRYQLRLAGVGQRILVSRRHAPDVRRRIEAMAGSKGRGQGLEPQVSCPLPLPTKSNFHPNGPAWRETTHG